MPPSDSAESSSKSNVSLISDEAAVEPYHFFSKDAKPLESATTNGVAESPPVASARTPPQAHKAANESEFWTVRHGGYRPPLTPVDTESSEEKEVSKDKANLSSR